MFGFCPVAGATLARVTLVCARVTGAAVQSARSPNPSTLFKTLLAANFLLHFPSLALDFLVVKPRSTGGRSESDTGFPANFLLRLWAEWPHRQLLSSNWRRWGGRSKQRLPGCSAHHSIWIVMIRPMAISYDCDTLGVWPIEFQACLQCALALADHRNFARAAAGLSCLSAYALPQHPGD